ncbi:MAG: protein phosphatase 2C domain-containing protein [Lachnospiraceae bacterium]|nr:protein phosphatase 2C domain-containing protein [Lachnospiraceae bacterium]
MIDMDKLEHCCICSDRGGYRPYNEDSFICNKMKPDTGADRLEEAIALKNGWNICGVLDGMGGTEHGGMASFLAASEFAGIRDAISGNEKRKELDGIVRAAFLKANNRIVENAGYSGTTATIAVTDGNELKLYHLGDSRAFLIHQGSIRQLTKDQTVETLKKDMGLSDRVVEADRHRLTEYLGADESMKGIRPVESEWIPFSDGDSLILCTDGLYEGCSQRDMLFVIDRVEPAKVASELVDLALSRGVRDNVTCAYIY